jgi:hypothetical protein
MSEFYFFYKKKLNNVNCPYPRIYGLTASPIKKGVKGSIEESVIKAMEKLSENLDSVIIIDPEMNNSNAKMIKPGESISQYLNDDCYIEVRSHIEMEEYKKVIVMVYNNCYIDLIKMAFYSIKSKYPEFSDIKFIEQYQEYVKARLKARNLEDYNSCTEKYIDLYNFRKLSSVFSIFEKMQRQIFMILENLCLDSLILYFNKLNDIYNKLYAQKLEEEENVKNSVKLNMLNHYESHDNDNDIDNEIDSDSEIDEEKYNQKVKEELQIMLIKKYLALDFYKIIKSLGNLKENENIYKENLKSPIYPMKFDEQGRVKISNKEEFINYLNYLRYLMGYSNAKHSSPYENIKDFVKKDILSRINDDNNKENVNINYYGENPNNKKLYNKKIINLEEQPHTFITKNNNNELKNEKEFNNLGKDDKKSNFVLNYKKGNSIENDDTFNYLKKTKKFIDEISSADTLDYEVKTIIIDIDKEEDNINRKISENNKSIKSYSDSNIKQEIHFMNNLNHFNFNS